MEFKSINEVSSEDSIISFNDVAMFLNITYPEAVNVILEAYNELTDFEIINEIVDMIHLPLSCVIEPGKHIVHGYIREVAV